jgi:hypothetical protein
MFHRSVLEGGVRSQRTQNPFFERAKFLNNDTLTRRPGGYHVVWAYGELEGVSRVYVARF